MSEKLRILILEDRPADAELELREVRQEGLEFTSVRVETEADFRRQLLEFRPDLILADYSLPTYDGTSALAVAQKECPDVPFLLVSGSLGEERAVDALHNGAKDFILKQRLARLGPSVRRALHEAKERRQRRQAEAALRDSEALYHSLVENVPQHVFRKDRAGRFTFGNGPFCQSLGRPLAELLGKTDLDFFPPQLAAKYQQDDQRVLQTGQPFEGEEEHRQASGKMIFVHVVKTPLRDAAGQIVGLQGISWDITGRKQAEARIRAQARLLDLAHDAIVVHDLEDRVLYWNQGAVTLYGWTTGEALGRKVTELCAPHGSASQAARETLLQTGHWAGELRQTDKHRRELVVINRWTLVRDEQGQPESVLVINTDITEKKKLEAQFLRAQRLEGVGRLAGGIAHDLNNILAPILMAAGMLREEAHTVELRTLATTLEQSAQRGADVVKQLLTFARGTEGQKIPVPPSRLLKDMVKIIQSSFPKSLDLHTHAPADLWMIPGDPTQLHQVLLNLCVNARDAMPEGGTLSLTAENVTFDECYARLSPEAKAGPYVVLQVADTGTGMSREILEKIFDPFFTTKGPDTGTGLGLATVQGIVNSHGGFIQVESQVGRGSQFRVYLPAAPTSSAAATVAPGGELPRGAGELVLVVDDERTVREVTRTILERHGYRVLTANEGTAALTLYTQHRADIQVVLSDLMMPIMDGPATIRALRGLNPQLKIIAASGAASRQRLTEVTDLPVQAYLQKPFTARRLLTTLHQVLRGQTTPPTEANHG